MDIVKDTRIEKIAEEARMTPEYLSEMNNTLSASLKDCAKELAAYKVAFGECFLKDDITGEWCYTPKGMQVQDAVIRLSSLVKTVRRELDSWKVDLQSENPIVRDHASFIVPYLHAILHEAGCLDVE